MRIVMLFLLSVLCSTVVGQTQPKEEFRGVWVASVLNIDYPQKPTSNTNLLKEEWLHLLDEFSALNFNALIVQIRPAGDALYPTSYAPWSAYLTGQQGLAPKPYFDPLEFMIQTAHERNMEFHAWLNPYRLSMNTNTETLAPNHPLFVHPEWIEEYAGKYYFNPALPAVQQHITDVTEEIVRNYDVDAIHFDDYFYPYKVDNQEFPDYEEYRNFGQSFRSQLAFREYSVTRMIEMVSAKIKEVKPHVRFGISPFGVWRNAADDVRGSDTRAGVRAYDDLHAHIIEWCRRDLIDYVAPQLYWHIGFEPADYQKLVNWWQDWRFAKNLYIGHAAYKLGVDKRPEWNDPEEIPRQIALNRQNLNIGGSAYFSASKIRLNPLNLIDKFKIHQKHPAKLPEIITIDVAPAVAPQLSAKADQDNIYLNWKKFPEVETEPYYYILYRFEGIALGNLNDPANILTITPFGKQVDSFIEEGVEVGTVYTYAITAVNRAHTESKPRVLTVQKKKKKIKEIR